VANVVPSSVASRGTSARALARATIYGDFVDDAGNRFYQYDMEQANRLVKEATLVQKLKQLRKLHAIDRKKRRPHLN
jgi:hypothetical protein